MTDLEVESKKTEEQLLLGQHRYDESQQPWVPLKTEYRMLPGNSLIPSAQILARDTLDSAQAHQHYLA